MIYYITKYEIPTGSEKGIWVFIEKIFSIDQVRPNDIFSGLIKIELPLGIESELNAFNHTRVREEKFLKLL